MSESEKILKGASATKPEKAGREELIQGLALLDEMKKQYEKVRNSAAAEQIGKVAEILREKAPRIINDASGIIVALAGTAVGMGAAGLGVVAKGFKSEGIPLPRLVETFSPFTREGQSRALVAYGVAYLGAATGVLIFIDKPIEKVLERRIVRDYLVKGGKKGV